MPKLYRSCCDVHIAAGMNTCIIPRSSAHGRCSNAGAGKTAIAEAAAAATLARGQRVIYTTPLKALSNQKLYEARKRFGMSRAGLQTGDTSLNTEADIVIMTTEILRNIMYRTAEIQGDGSSEWRLLLQCVLWGLHMWTAWHCDALLYGARVMPRVLAWCRGKALSDALPAPLCVSHLHSGLYSPLQPWCSAGRCQLLLRRLQAACKYHTGSKLWGPAALLVPPAGSASTREERLGDVGLIVLDEVHYLGDPGRGSVWEEVIINCPKHIQLLGMSATVKNPDDLGDWISKVGCQAGQCRLAGAGC